MSEAELGGNVKEKLKGCGSDEQRHVGKKPFQSCTAESKDYKNKKLRRFIFGSQQVKELEATFAKTMYPDFYLREEIAQRLNLKEPQVKIWFTNRRSKCKREHRIKNQMDKFAEIINGISSGHPSYYNYARVLLPPPPSPFGAERFAWGFNGAHMNPLSSQQPMALTPFNGFPTLTQNMGGLANLIPASISSSLGSKAVPCPYPAPTPPQNPFMIPCWQSPTHQLPPAPPPAEGETRGLYQPQIRSPQHHWSFHI